MTPIFRPGALERAYVIVCVPRISGVPLPAIARPSTELDMQDMDFDKRITVVLLALTGFGNPVLKALLTDVRVQVGAVFTVKYDRPFPFYAEQHLIDLCAARGVTCYHGVKLSSTDGLVLLSQHAPDLILVATFKQMLAPTVLALPRLGVVNLHPSLLPRYRGPCPTNAALLNGDQSTGITAHYVVEEMDAGNILLQRALLINSDETDGTLRRRLAELAGTMTPQVIGLFMGPQTPAGLPQQHTRATPAPRPAVEDGYLETAPDVVTVYRRVRGLNPLPGTSVLVNDERIAVNGCAVIDDGRTPGVYPHLDCVDLVLADGAVRLFMLRPQGVPAQSTVN